MPSQLQHELNKIRGIVTSTGQVFTSSIASLSESINIIKEHIKCLNSEQNNIKNKLNNTRENTSKALSSAKASIKYSDKSHNLTSIISDAITGLRIWSSDLSTSAYIASDTGYSTFPKIKTDTIEEITGASGVNIDGVILKDSLITANRTRKIFITPYYTTGENAEKGILLDGIGGSEYITFHFKLPEDYVSILGINTIISRTAGIGGNIILDSTLYAGLNGEGYNNHTNVDANRSITIVGNLIVSALDHATLFTDITINDYIIIKIIRDSTDANDTYGADIRLKGIEIIYQAVV